ncbi:MAG: FkbM family methyltransferase [Cyclobacteriaceae bacterium]
MQVIPKYINILALQLLKKIRGNGFYYRIKDPVFGNAKWLTDKKTTNEFLLGIYEQELYRSIKIYLKKGDVFYDLGAHWGYFSIMSSRIVGNRGMVYAFEPMPSNHDRLERNLNINNIENVQVMALAVSDKEGFVEFSNSDDSYANTYKGDKSSSIKVKTQSLDNLINEEIRPPNFIKIDVEGAELDVLKGAQNLIKKYKPVIHLSTHDIHVPGIDSSCLKFLNEIDYRPDLISSKRGIKDYMCTPL